MKKLKSYIETWLDGKQVRGIHITPYEIWECVDIYNAIVKKGKPEFISGNVKKILDKCGIKTVEKGIGWRIA